MAISLQSVKIVTTVALAAVIATYGAGILSEAATAGESAPAWSMSWSQGCSPRPVSCAFLETIEPKTAMSYSSSRSPCRSLGLSGIAKASQSLSGTTGRLLNFLWPG